MIVVFVVDTSPSMGREADRGLSRLDLAKMLVEEVTRRWKRLRGPSTLPQLGQVPVAPNHFLLLSTSRQYPDTASCAAGGRLLVGFEPTHTRRHLENGGVGEQTPHAAAFARELKGLKAAKAPEDGRPWSDDLGGAPGLNAALSSGLQLLSRYRLQHRETENFGMGRLPSNSTILPNGSPAIAALQPACLVLVTDGSCIRNPPKLGGGRLEPLREFYKDRFRWDQRFFILYVAHRAWKPSSHLTLPLFSGVGAQPNTSSTQYLQSSLRELCEVTGGAHWVVSSSKELSAVSDSLIKHVCPPLPIELPLPDPLFQQLGNLIPSPVVATHIDACFVNSGPTVCFRSLEVEPGSNKPAATKAMLLYVGSSATAASQQTTSSLSPPLFCIPETFFPSKKLDILPKRDAHPQLFYSHHPMSLGSKSFDAMQVIKMLHRFDQMVAANRKLSDQPCKLLHRDVYVCNWVEPEGNKVIDKTMRKEYFPVIVRGAGRQTLATDGDNMFNIGILHSPPGSSTLGGQSSAAQLATLTLLPPEPHILLPLLIHAAETEHRTLKKIADRGTKPTGRTNIVLDDHWRAEMRAYLFRIPPYYQFTMKRCLWHVLPVSVHSLLQTETVEAMKGQCFSKACHHKILNAEQATKENNERFELQELTIRTGRNPNETPLGENKSSVAYGQYDPRTSEETYLNQLRGLSEPWRAQQSSQQPSNGRESSPSKTTETKQPKSILDILGDVPKTSLLAYYESRRRWIFGGSGQTVQGLQVDGVRNEGSNTQTCGRTFNDVDPCPLSMAGVGASMLNQTTTARMGEYRERLLFTRSPIVGYGPNDCTGVSATTAVDGSPTWSVDDDAMPATFFDPETGNFADSVDARVRSKLMVNFGNPFKEKRADSLIPAKFLDQTPSKQHGVLGGKDLAPGSPPNEAFESVEEGEAIYVQVRKSPSRTSPRREDDDSSVKKPPPPVAPPSFGLKSKSEPKGSDSSSPITPPPPKRPRAESIGKPGAKPAPPPPRTASRSRPPPPKPPKGKAPPPPPKAGSSKPRPCPPKRKSSVSHLMVDTEKGYSSDESSVRSLGSMSSQSMAPQTVSPSNAGVPKPPQPEPSAAAVPTLSTVPESIDSTSKMQEEEPPSVTQQQQPASGAAPTTGPETLEDSSDGKPKIDLPDGWIHVWSKSQKRYYFFDKKTNKSVWEWPPPS